MFTPEQKNHERSVRKANEATASALYVHHHIVVDERLPKKSWKNEKKPMRKKAKKRPYLLEAMFGGKAEGCRRTQGVRGTQVGLQKRAAIIVESPRWGKAGGNTTPLGTRPRREHLAEKVAV